MTGERCLSGDGFMQRIRAMEALYWEERRKRHVAWGLAPKTTARVGEPEEGGA